MTEGREMETYKNKTFCRGYKDSKKCKMCDKYFNQEDYDNLSMFIGFKMPISFYTKPLCEKGKQKAEL